MGRVVGQFFTRYDILLTPTMCKPPYRLGVLTMDATDPHAYMQAIFATIAFTSLFRHGNFDSVSNAVVWDPATASHALPSSLYLGAKPGWWPAATPWPWAGPDLSPMVGTLPAKQRSDAMGL